MKPETDTHKRLKNYMAGWHAGAGVKTIDPKLQDDNDYNTGWSHGKKATALAYETACHFLKGPMDYIRPAPLNNSPRCFKCGISLLGSDMVLAKVGCETIMFCEQCGKAHAPNGDILPTTA